MIIFLFFTKKRLDISSFRDNLKSQVFYFVCVLAGEGGGDWVWGWGWWSGVGEGIFK